MPHPRRRVERIWCGLFCLLLLQSACAREELTATVTRVFDGDSFIARVADGSEVEVRLGGIDAPEKGQPYADRARTALRGMILHQQVRIAVSDIDKYHRKIAQVHRVSDGVHINALLVRQGYAWVYRRVAPNHPFRELERLAREEGLGLWALPEIERAPPWDWRQEHPSTRTTPH
ncbi:MAG TPA: thermonuclease family protein [Steroidobacteraceae bacterium]|nr:thermonuclease family protein [Steroidobacteraceae bacterium]